MGSLVYLAVANHGSEGRYETHSRIYTMDRTAKLTVIQDISTQGASDVKFFRLPGKSDNISLIVANQIDNAGQTRINSQVMQPGCVRLVLFQRFNENLDRRIGRSVEQLSSASLLCLHQYFGFGKDCRW